MKTLLTFIAVFLFVGCEENEKWLTKEEGYGLAAFIVVVWIFWEIIKLTTRISNLENESKYRREECDVLRDKVAKLERTPEEQEEWEKEERKRSEATKRMLEKPQSHFTPEWMGRNPSDGKDSK